MQIGDGSRQYQRRWLTIEPDKQVNGICVINQGWGPHSSAAVKRHGQRKLNKKISRT